MHYLKRASLIAALSVFIMVPLHAFAVTTVDDIFSKRLKNHYGEDVSLEVAKKVSAAAIAEGVKNGWQLCVAIVDTGGELVYFERADGSQKASPEIAIEKARAAVAFRRSTKLLEDRVVAGRLQYLRLPFAMPIEGGVPLIINEKVVGAIAVSGARSEQDGVAARAAIEELYRITAQDKK